MYEVGDIAHYKDSYDHWHQSEIKHVGTNMLGEYLYGLEDGFWLLEDRIAFCERKEPAPFITKEIPDSIIKNLEETTPFSKGTLAKQFNKIINRSENMATVQTQNATTVKDYVDAINGLKRIFPDFEQLYVDNIDNDKYWDNLHGKCELKGTVETNVSAYLYIAQAISLLEGLVIK